MEEQSINVIVAVFQRIVEGRVRTRAGAQTLRERLLVYVKTVTMATTANMVRLLLHTMYQCISNC